MRFLFLFLFFVVSCAAVEQKENVSLVKGNLILVEGKVSKKTVMPGTFSEFSYYTISIKDKGEVIIFNKQLYSLGFERFVGRDVEIRGNFTIGYIGYSKKKKKGFKAIKIELQDKSYQ